MHQTTCSPLNWNWGEGFISAYPPDQFIMLEQGSIYGTRNDQIWGALETFRNTGEAHYFRIADDFWNIVTNSYMYSIGGVAGASNPNNAECFTAEPDTLFENGFHRGGQCETCGTYNLHKLDRQLFMFDHPAGYMDHYERGLYNQILASVAEENAGNTYHIHLNPGARKNFGNADMTGFTCCNGTALESSTKLQDSICFRSIDNRTLYINLFIPSTLTWHEQDPVMDRPDIASIFYGPILLAAEETDF